MHRAILLLITLPLACLPQQPHTATNGGTSTNVPQWLRFFGDGNEGPYMCGATCQLSGEHWYSSVSIAGTVHVTFANSPLVVRATGACTINGTVANSTNSSGAAGNDGSGDFGATGGGGGGGSSGFPGSASFANKLAGSPGTMVQGALPGAAGAVGHNGNGPAQPAQQLFEDLGFPWPIGGGAGGAGGNSGGAGGFGGGVVVFVCATVTFNSGAAIDVSGQAGTAAPSNGTGGGGGGGGGVVILSGLSVTSSGSFNTGGGSGGAAQSMNSGAGGNGGAGFYKVFTIE